MSGKRDSTDRAIEEMRGQIKALELAISHLEKQKAEKLARKASKAGAAAAQPELSVADEPSQA